MAITALGLASCGNDDAAESDAAESEQATVGSDVDRCTLAPGEEGEDAILIETHPTIPTGEVLPGSVIGDTPFCTGGTFLDEHGSLEVTLHARPADDDRGGQPLDRRGGSGSIEGLSGQAGMTVTFAAEASPEG